MPRTFWLILVMPFFLSCSGESVESPDQTDSDSVERPDQSDMDFASYSLCFSANKEVHEESGPRAVGGGTGESVIVHLNGHPIWFKWNRGFYKPVNQFMVNKRNIIEVEGDLTTIGYVKITRTVGTKATDILRFAVSPSNDRAGGRSTFQFSESVPYEIKVDNVMDDGRRRDEVTKTVVDKARSLYTAIASGDHDVAARLLSEGYRRWAHDAYGQSKQHIEEVVENYKTLWKTNGFTITEPNWKSVRLLFGEKSVFMYTAWDERSGNPYLFEAKIREPSGKQTKIKLWSLRFVFSKGKCVIWSPQ